MKELLHVSMVLVNVKAQLMSPSLKVTTTAQENTLISLIKATDKLLSKTLKAIKAELLLMT